MLSLAGNRQARRQANKQSCAHVRAKTGRQSKMQGVRHASRITQVSKQAGRSVDENVLAKKRDEKGQKGNHESGRKEAGTQAETTARGQACKQDHAGHQAGW